MKNRVICVCEAATSIYLRMQMNEESTETKTRKSRTRDKENAINLWFAGRCRHHHYLVCFVWHTTAIWHNQKGPTTQLLVVMKNVRSAGLNKLPVMFLHEYTTHTHTHTPSHRRQYRIRLIRSLVEKIAAIDQGEKV